MTASPPTSPSSPSPAPAGRAAVRSSDAALIELLRTEGTPGIGSLAEALGVTATAVRQRLERLMREGIVARELVGRSPATGQGRPRGRPAYGYRLTERGQRTGGDNFRDLALVLWDEIRSIRSPEIRRGAVARIGAAMAQRYRGEVTGATVAERLDETVGMLRARQIACAAETAPAQGSNDGALAVLTSHVCPYPDLAEHDRGICSAERLMLQDLLGTQVALASCRLDGADCCRFHVATPATGENAVEVSPPHD